MTPHEMKQIRAQLGISQAALGRLLRLDVRTIRRYEAGSRTPPGPVVLLYELLRDPAFFRLNVKLRDAGGSRIPKRS